MCREEGKWGVHGKDGRHAIPIRRFCNPQIELDAKVDERVQVLL